MQISDVKSYKLIQKKELTDINSEGYLLEHIKTGAKVVLIENDDKNKTFLIGFRTPVTNSTGVPHIMEHSVLCGSRKFPVKDPFIELAKGSLNTFLNAMTFPDKTIFPIASENDKDFQNLMDVYMDAVFYPKIYEREEIFRQEGWTYELPDKDGELKYNGVVYNEMKGAFSSPDEVVEREIMSSLFPDNGYKYESGGDPDVIPELSYEEFKDFHKKYYHPSNSYIYLYGDMDMAEKLKWMDEEYLSAFEKEDIDSEIKEQAAFDSVKNVEIDYPVAAGESIEDNSYLSYNNVVGKITDKELYVAFQVLEYALVSMPGAPVKQALLDKGIGKDIDGKYNNWIYQPYFSIIAKNAGDDRKEEFVQTIMTTLTELADKGIDRNSLLAALNYYEFQYRESDFGSYPKGIMLSFQVLDSWLYDENRPFIHLEENEVFEQLRKKIDTGYFEELVKKYFINNTHASIVVANPKRGMTTEHDENLKETLQKYKDSLTDEEIAGMVEFTKHLEEYKNEPSPAEELEKIPLLKIKDISDEIKPFKNEEIDVNGVKVIYHDIFTNGIGYLNIAFDVTDVPCEYYPYLGLLKAVLGFMNTDKYSYSELVNEINMNSGGIFVDAAVYTSAKNPEKYKIYTSIGAKVFDDKIDFAMNIIPEIINTTKFRDEKRLFEILSELKSKMQMSMTHFGDSTALLRNLSYYSESAAVSEEMKGISFYKTVEGWVKNYDSEKEKIMSELSEVAKAVFNKDKMFISYTSDRAGLEMLKGCIGKFAEQLPEVSGTVDAGKITPVKKNEGLKTSAQIQYVTRAGNFIKEGYEYDGSLKVLRTILNYEYLWNNVRVNGGAYGAGSGFNRSGDCYFTSYRDPKIKETNDVFESIPKYLEEFEVSERDMTKFIIGTISSMDTPLTPRTDGARSMGAYISELTEDDLRKERRQVLDTDVNDIRKHADMIKAVLKQDNICVLGNEDNIEKAKELFKNTVDLFE